MPIPNNGKHRQYANYAAHCLTMGVAADDPVTRDIQREMALEWLTLADAVLRSTDGAVLIPSHLS
jgi:hypothetical protein